MYRPLKVYLISMAMGWVQQKKDVQLDPKYKLPKMRYKGNDGVTPQTMRMDTKPLVTEMRDVPEDPEFPLLTKRRPITVSGPPKASKEALKAETAPPRPSPDPPKTGPCPQAAAHAKQQSAEASSSVLKEAAVRLPASAQNGSAVPSGMLNPMIMPQKDLC